MKRREFLKSTAILAAATTAPGVVQASNLFDDKKKVGEKKDDPKEEHPSKLIASAPMLQNYAETSMGVTFAVNDMANGYVIYGQQPNLSDGRKVMCGGYRTTEISDKVIQVRLTGLKPSTTYYYRIGADRISYKGGYDMKILGNEEDTHIYHFTTAGKQSKAHFCVINDTHVQWGGFGKAIEKIAALSPSCVVWNGDACNVEETIEDQKRIFLIPEIDRKDYAAQIPYLFTPGNHDTRGMANRHFEKIWMYRQPEERKSRDWDLGRNYAVRMGDVAMIGLDTAEDKQDTNPIFAGLFNSEAYREAQVAWLHDALAQPEIKKAPYLVAFCHIPLFDTDPTHNPGDVRPDDKDPQYSTDYAVWQRACAKMWTPQLKKAKCQLVITAHQHLYRYDAPTADRPWAHMVGGGPEKGNFKPGEDDGKNPDHFPTVIEGKVMNGKLHITVHNLRTGKVAAEFDFKKR